MSAKGHRDEASRQIATVNQVLCGQPRGLAVPRRTFIVMVFTAARLYTPLEEIEDPLLFVQDGTITKMSSREQSETPQGASLVDFDEAILAPGFVDIHMHAGTRSPALHPPPLRPPPLCH